jgi:hypothetical protein
MPALCDVNFLLALCYDGHIHHPPALARFEQQGDAVILICRNTQMGLLRLLTNRSVMGEAVCTQQQAWAVYDAITRDMHFEFSPEPEGLENFLRQYSASNQVTPKLWQDAYLAAFARAANLHLVTFDRGFHQFNGLDVILLT